VSGLPALYLSGRGRATGVSTTAFTTDKKNGRWHGKKISSSRLLADLTTRNRTKDTLISAFQIYSQMLCQLSYGEPEEMFNQKKIMFLEDVKLSQTVPVVLS
jgi:hypothetical protein